MQVVLITGAAQGIGRAIAERFLQDGFSLVAVDRNRQGSNSLKGNVAVAELDVTASDAPARAIGLRSG